MGAFPIQSLFLEVKLQTILGGSTLKPIAGELGFIYVTDSVGGNYGYGL